MPGRIAITGASGQVGTLLQERLAEPPTRVTPLDRDADWTSSIHEAEVVVHLAGTLQPRGKDTYESANVSTSETVAAAARGSSVRRIVFLSYVGAAVHSANAYLRAKGWAEKALTDSGVPTTIFRCLDIYGPPERRRQTAQAYLAQRGSEI